MPYLPQLDGLRAVAVLIVFVAHAGYNQSVPGGFGVTIFFFLSGYLITTLLRIEHKATGSISLRGFYLRRCLRIMPPMYLTLAFSGLLYASGWLDWPPVDFAAVLGQLTYLTNYPDLLGTEQVLPVPLWSLAIEEHFYLVFPLAFLFWLGRLEPKHAAIACLVICFGVLALRVFNVWRLEDYSLNYSWTHTRLDALLFGCCLGVWNNPVLSEDHAWRPRLGHIAIAGAVILGSLAIRNEAFRQTLRYTLQSAALFVVFSAVIQNRGVVAKLLSSKVMRQIGLYSYTFYLVHYTFIVLIQHLQPGISRPLLIASAFPPTLAYCWVMYGLVERPCARLRRRLVDGGGQPLEPTLDERENSVVPLGPLLKRA